MSSLIQRYEYDIFISYRHNDNRSGWVTEFVAALQQELAATIKEQVSVYFDTNPHDGLLETHDVDGSLKEKIKCLVFIPIVSQTYCDPKSFAWQKELLPFLDFAGSDEYGLDIRLSGGNIAKRVLPVRIHEIDEADKNLFENAIAGVLRPLDFIYKDAGVNRPLTPTDNPDKNLNHILYRDQINKTANAVKAVITSMGTYQTLENSKIDLSRELTGTEDSQPAKQDLSNTSAIRKKGRPTQSLIADFRDFTRRPIAKKLVIVFLILIILSILVFPGNFFSADQSIDASKRPVQLDIVFPEGSPLALLGPSASEFDQYPSMSLSPDGKALCFVGMKDGNARLFLRYMNNGEIIPIPGTDGAHFPFFSPDGKWIAYDVGGYLKKVMLPDGTPINIARSGTIRGGAVWTESDEIVFSTYDEILKVPARGGDPVVVRPRGADVLSFFDTQISITPDQKYILYSDYKGDVYGLNLANNETKLIYANGGGSPHYTPTGHLTFVRSNVLFAIPFDLERIKPFGKESIVVNGIRGTRNGPHLTFSNDGTLIYVPGGYDQKTVFKWVDKDGLVQAIGIEPDNYGSFDLSPDGKMIAVSVLPAQDYILIFDLSTGRSSRIRVEGAKQLYSPVWAPDNKSIIFGVRTGDEWSLYLKKINDTGEATQLKLSAEITGVESWPYSFSESGKFVTVDNWLLAYHHDKNELVKIEDKSSNRNHIEFSPHDDFIVYSSSESGQPEIYVQPYPETGEKWQLTVDGGTDPVWSSDSNRIYFHNNFNIYYVEVKTQEKFKYESPVIYYSGRFLNAISRSLAINKDGRLLFLEPLRESQIATKAIVTINWFDELKRLAPPNK